MEKFKGLVPRVMLLALGATLLCNGLAYYGTRLFMGGRPHVDLTNGFDRMVPFVPWTIVIYWGCYIFWIVNYILGCRQEKETAFRFLGADLIAKLVCLVCFIVFPTTNVRPVIEGDSVWELLMKLLYEVDAADNLFPSIHCLTSWFCFIAVRENKNIGKWYKWVSVLLALSICVSTLTTKQHVWPDVIAGVLLAEGSYLFVKRTGFSGWYGRKLSLLEQWVWERGTLREE